MAATLARVEERSRESHGRRVHPQFVCVGDATGQHEAVVLLDVHLARRSVHRERIRLVEVVERLRLTGLRRDQVSFGSCVDDRLPRFRQLNLFDPFVRDEKGDPLTFQFTCHGDLPHRSRGP
jgi:hypothetical protein